MVKRFICDGMLGKLCKLLRIVGIDASYSNEGMAILLTARKEDRIILTRNTRLRGKEKIFFIETTRPARQLFDIISTYDLWDEIAPFARCVVCNERLIIVEKENIKDKIPYYTFNNFDKYAQCPCCDRVYWKGSHYQNMMKEVEAILGVPLIES